MNYPLRAVAISALVLLMSCEDRTTPTSTVDASSCIALSGQPSVIGSEMIFSVGELDGAEGPTFGSINDLAATANGDLIAIDGMTRQLLLISESGEVQQTIGRQGSGPGEFEAPWIVDALEKGGAVVIDTKLWRATQVHPDGQLAPTRLEPDVNMGQAPQVFVDGQGQLFQLSLGPFEASVTQRLGSRRSGVVRGDAALRRWDDASSTWLELDRIPGPEVYADLDLGGLMNPPFPAGPVFAPRPGGGYWYADSHDLVISQHDGTGDVLCELRLPLEQQEVSSDERDAFYGATEFTGASEATRARVRERRASIPMPSVKPYIEGLVDGGNRLWVKTPSSEDDRTPWHSVDLAKGAWELVRFPSSFTLLAATGDQVYGVSRDSLGVSRVVGYRLAAPESPDS